MEACTNGRSNAGFVDKVANAVGKGRQSRFISYVVGFGGLLLLLCACATQEQPTATPGDAPPSATLAAPTSMPTRAPAGEPPGEAGSDAGGGLSLTTDLEIQVPEAVHIVPGETATYTLTVRNNGPALAAGVILTGHLPSGLIPVWTQLAEPFCLRQADGVICDLGALPEEQAAVLTLDLSAAGAGGLVTATQLAGATIDLPLPTCAIDPDPARPLVACSLSRLEPGAELPVRIAVGAEPRLSGSLAHTVTVAADGADLDPANNRATLTMTIDFTEGPVLSPAERPVLSPVEGAVSAMADLVLHADGPSTVVAGRPFTYTYTITNRGALDATGVVFEDVVPSDLDLIAYAPRAPQCERRGDALTCTLRDLDGSEIFTLTLIIAGHGDQPMQMALDPLLPGWPACSILKERTWQHIVQCELGGLKPGQEAGVRLVFVPVGVRARVTANTAAVRADEIDANPLDNTSTTTLTVQVESGSGE